VYGSRWTPGACQPSSPPRHCPWPPSSASSTQTPIWNLRICRRRDRINAKVRFESVALSDLPPTWRKYPAPPQLASIGERWLREARTVALSVPSVVIPRERNFIVNPAHADFGRLTVASPEPFSFDPRMWKTR